MKENIHRQKALRLMMLVLACALGLFLAAAFSQNAYAASRVNMKKVKARVTSGVTFYQDSYTTKWYRTHPIAEKKPTFVVKLKLTGGKKHVFDSRRDRFSVSLRCGSAYRGKVTIVKKKLKKNVISIYLRSSGTARVRLYPRVNGKKFGPVTVSIFNTEMDRSLLLGEGASAQLQVRKLLTKGKKVYGGKIIFSSSDSGVASVSSKGIVSAHKAGSAVIYAKVGKSKLGCVVSVTSPAKAEAVRKAYWMVSEWTYYSDPYWRMQDGYYDCSALTWKVLHEKVCDFGDKSFAPTAAEQCRYLEKKGRMLGKFTRANEQKMTYQAGDVFFKIDGSDDYKGIGHVELISGYEFQGFTTDGKAVVRLTAPKVEIYDEGSNILIGRP